MPEDRTRPFGVLDAMILTAAIAVGLMIDLADRDRPLHVLRDPSIIPGIGG